MSKPDPKRSLDEWLACWTVPTQRGDDADGFTEKVARAIRHSRRPAAEPHPAGRRFWSWSLASGLAVAVIVALVFWPTRPPGDLSVLDRHPAAPATDAFALWQGVKQLFPGRLAALELQNGKTSLAVSDSLIAPEAAPVFVRFCRASECRSFVTVSGQQIAAFGTRFEVIEEADGGVIVLSDQLAWSSRMSGNVVGEIAVDAHVLEARRL